MVDPGADIVFLEINEQSLSAEGDIIGGGRIGVISDGIPAGLDLVPEVIERRLVDPENGAGDRDVMREEALRQVFGVGGVIAPPIGSHEPGHILHVRIVCDAQGSRFIPEPAVGLEQIWLGIKD